MTKTELALSEIMDVRPLGSALAESRHTPLLDTDRLKIKRMVLPKGKEFPEHKAHGEITVHCLEGRIEFTATGKTVELEPGQLIHLEALQLHSVKAVEDSSFLLTVFLHPKS